MQLTVACWFVAPRGLNSIPVAGEKYIYQIFRHFLYILVYFFNVKRWGPRHGPILCKAFHIPLLAACSSQYILHILVLLFLMGVLPWRGFEFYFLSFATLVTRPNKLFQCFLLHDDSSWNCFLIIIFLINQVSSIFSSCPPQKPRLTRLQPTLMFLKQD